MILRDSTAKILILALVAVSCLSGSTSNLRAQVTFDWATVGNTGNAADTTGFGAVSDVYRISKYEVTNAQYTEFLNAVDPTGANSRALYSSSMSSSANGGIDFNSGAANGAKYQIKSGRDDNPVNYVSFFDAMRFTNWLQNGQGSGSTESGVYTIGDGVNESRDPGAVYFIPNADEWYKAAYHKNDGVTANYWDYPTSTDAVPYSDQPPGSGAPTPSNTANFFKNDGTANGFDDGYAVTGSATFSSTQNYLTDVGAYEASSSPYGTYDQGGNVLEWNEAVTSPSFRGLRGGSWRTFSGSLLALSRFNDNPTNETDAIGFRVASVPEPTSLLLGALGMMVLLPGRRRLS